MEKLDVAVAVVGAVILVVATTGAVLTQTDGERGLYDLTVVTGTSAVDEGEFSWDATAQAFEQVAGFDLSSTNVTVVRVIVQFTPTAVGPAAPDIAYRIELAAPNGTSVVEDASTPLAPSGAGGAVEVVIEMPIRAAPPNGTVAAGTPEEAVQGFAAGPNATGAWTLTIQGARNAPSPTTVAWRAEAETFAGSARPTL